MPPPAGRCAIFVRDLMEAWGFSRSTAHRHLRAGDFGPVHQLPGGRLYVLRADYDKAIEGMRLPDPDPERVPRELRPREDLRRYFERQGGGKRIKKGASRP